MNKKLQELRRNLTQKLKEARTAIDAGNIEEGQKLTEEAETIKTEIALEGQVADLEEVVDDTKVTETDDATRAEKKQPLESRTVLTRFIQGKNLNKEERDLLVQTTDPLEDQNSVAIIVPQDIYTKITELKRQYRPLKEFVDVQSTGTSSGSFVWENGDAITPLLDLTEGTEIGELTSPTLKQKTFAIKDKGGILPISNTLLADEKGGLWNYIMKWFARKSVITDNQNILKILKANGVQLTCKSPEEVKTAINTKLDPALLNGMVIVTNQNGFNIMDNWKDAVGRPLLQPNPTDPTRKMCFGINVEIFSNALIPDVAGKSPAYIGNLEEAVKFMDREQMVLAVSKEAGFTKNLIMIRAIQRDDVISKDEKSYLNIKLTPQAERVIYVKKTNEAPEEEPTEPEPEPGTE